MRETFDTKIAYERYYRHTHGIDDLTAELACPRGENCISNYTESWDSRANYTTTSPYDLERHGASCNFTIEFDDSSDSE